MRYFGGKSKVGKEIAEVINGFNAQSFVDLFCGSCNVIQHVKSPVRYANDINQAIVSTMEAAAGGYDFPDTVTEADYKSAKSLEDTDPLKGFILFGCSFAGKSKVRYARNNRGDNYAAQAKRGLTKKAANLQSVKFFCCPYEYAPIPEGALVYCDIPYHARTEYRDRFNHAKFYEWVRQQSNTVLISEYKNSFNPLGLPDIWEKPSRQCVQNKYGEQVPTVEVIRAFNI